jgi:hypothetical protein
MRRVVLGRSIRRSSVFLLLLLHIDRREKV